MTRSKGKRRPVLLGRVTVYSSTSTDVTGTHPEKAGFAVTTVSIDRSGVRQKCVYSAVRVASLAVEECLTESNYCYVEGTPGVLVTCAGCRAKYLTDRGSVCSK